MSSEPPPNTRPHLTSHDHPEEAPDELDDKIREHFPTARWVGKHSYIGVGHELDDFWSFADWLANRLTRIPEPAAE